MYLHFFKYNKYVCKTLRYITMGQFSQKIKVHILITKHNFETMTVWIQVGIVSTAKITLRLITSFQSYF